MRGLALLLLVIGGLAVSVPPAPQRAASGPEVYRRAVAGSAWVRTSGQGVGSGFVVDAGKKLLVTCYHVVGENETCEVVFVWNNDSKAVAARSAYLEKMPELQRRGIAVQGRVIKRSKDKDLALVELPSLPNGVKALPLAEQPAGPGERVWAVGNRYDADTLFTAAAGRVRLLRSMREGYFSGGQQLAKGAKLLLADVPINEGDSGGALVNERGEVVGVRAAVAWEAHGGGLFVDLSELRAFLGSDAPPSTAPPAGATAYRRALRSTALVQYEGGGRFAGVVVDRARRLVLTTAEAVAKEKAVEVGFAVEQPVGTAVEAKWYAAQRELLRRKGYASTGVVLAVDPRRNLALLEVERLPDSVGEVRFRTTPASPGEPLHLISHPARLDVLWAYSAAIVRQRNRFQLGRAEDGPAPAVLIAQAPLSESEGGGPALDENGELAGFISGKVGPQQQIAYLLDAGEVRSFLEEVRPSSAPRTAAEHVARAELLIAARQFARAKTEYNAALKLDERSAVAFAGRAWLAQLMNKPDDALKDADRALTLDGKQVLARCARAAAWLAKGDARRAKAECDLALKDDPKSALTFALRSLARLESGDPAGAAADADEAVWLDAKLAVACLARGRALAAREQNGRALEEFGRAAALDPHLSEAHRRRGDLLWHNSDVDGAAAAYDRALTIAPSDGLALLGRGRARLAKGSYDEGLADLDDAVRLRPDLAETYLHRGGEKVRRNWVNKGTADLLEAIRRRPALLSAALAELMRRSADLPAPDEALALQLTLKGIAAALDGGLRKRLQDGLAAASGQKEEAKRAEALRQLVAVVRAKSAER